ncbi:hypothetical protein MRX96_052687, partial [Rhipicephalus microplus]
MRQQGDFYILGKLTSSATKKGLAKKKRLGKNGGYGTDMGMMGHGMMMDPMMGGGMGMGMGGMTSGSKLMT